MSIELVNDYVLISGQPNWRTQVTCSRQWETEVAAIVTGAEDRGAMRETPRLRLQFEPLLLTVTQQAQHDAAVIAAMRSGKAAVPYWGRASDLASDASGTSATIATNSWPWQVNDYAFFLDATDLENPVYCVRQITGKTGLVLTLDSALPQTFKAGALIWPLLFGKLSIDDQAALTSHRAPGRLTLEEAAGSTRSNVPTVTNFLSRPVFTTAINWLDGVSRSFSFDLRELQIGFGAEVYTPLQLHAVNGFVFGLQLSTESDILNHEDFFAALHGRLKGFWLPAPIEAFDIVAGISTTQFDIKAQGLADSWELQPSIYLWLTQDGTSSGGKIVDVTDNGDGTERITLESALAFTPDASTVVSKLHYVRLTDDKEEASFIAEWFEKRTLRVVELPTEYAAAETGEQPVYLYHIWIETQPVAQHWYYTSFAGDIVSNSQTYAAKPITHGSLKKGIKGDAEKVTIEAFHEIGHPFLFGFPYPPSRPIKVEILETTFGDPDTTITLFTGQVDSAPRKGNKISASCISLLDLDSQRLPNALMGPRCAYHVYDPDTCGVVRDSTWEKAGTITSINGRTIQVTLSASYPAVDHWFAFGWIETGASETEEIRTILDDTKISDTVRELTLDLPLQHATLANAISVIRGCDGKWSTCTGIFGNDKFMGHPYIPTKNPTLVAVDAPVSQGGKK